MLNELAKRAGAIVRTCLVTWAVVSVMGCEAEPTGPYDKSADPFESRDRALVEARSTRKPVLLVFGADWCPDCLELNKQMKMEPLATLIAKEFVTVHVDIGNLDRNMDFVAEYDNPVSRGIPSVVLIDADNRPLKKTSAGELANARTMPPEALLRWFEDLTRLSAR